MWDQPQRGFGYDGIITSLAKGKQREKKIVSENISMITAKVRVLKLFLLIRLVHRTLPEEKNSGEINLRP